ncbi:PilN domain-containing protein [Marinobacter caseinilyticus]|uniref:PilN domain-containing protein n=1 Tax=Marinobacter caseinilyticus TaxID=2692195 RepID=UPI001408E142|nr:PilN domain-containing protein [Marinobacter caseinilyticus]
MTQHINLYTDELRPRQEPFQVRHVVVVAMACLLLVVASAAYVRYESHTLNTALAGYISQQQLLEVRVAELTAAVESRQIDPDLVTAIDELSGNIVRRQRLLVEVQRLVGSGGEGFSPYMAAMARQIPEGVWLTGFKIDLRAADVQLSGRTRSGDRVPVYLERLGDEPVFSGRQFARFKLERHASGQWIDFDIATERMPGNES